MFLGTAMSLQFPETLCNSLSEQVAKVHAQVRRLRTSSQLNALWHCACSQRVIQKQRHIDAFLNFLCHQQIQENCNSLTVSNALSLGSRQQKKLRSVHGQPWAILHVTAHLHMHCCLVTFLQNCSGRAIAESDTLTTCKYVIIYYMSRGP